MGAGASATSSVGRMMRVVCRTGSRMDGRAMVFPLTSVLFALFSPLPSS